MSGGAFPNFDVSVVDGVAVITIARPEKLNALNSEMVDALVPLCRSIERRKDVFAVTLTGQGTAFCAGDQDADQRSRRGGKQARPRSTRRADRRRLPELAEGLARFRKKRKPDFCA